MSILQKKFYWFIKYLDNFLCTKDPEKLRNIERPKVLLLFGKLRMKFFWKRKSIMIKAMKICALSFTANTFSRDFVTLSFHTNDGT